MAIKTSTEIYGSNEWSEIRQGWVGPHVKVWEDFMEVEVPFDDNGRRCHIHHLDGNPRNNDILNLVCMTESEHHRVDGKLLKNKGWKRTEEQKRKISATLTGRKNGPPSEETRRKISEGQIGKTVSEETRRKISNTKTGKPMSEAQKKATSEGLKKWWTERKGGK